MTQRSTLLGQLDWLPTSIPAPLRSVRTYSAIDAQRALATIETVLGGLFQSTALTADQLEGVRRALSALDELRALTQTTPRPLGRVLVADHDATRGDSVRQALAHAGHVVEFIQSCENTMDSLIQFDPQVIVASQRLLSAEDRLFSRLRTVTKARLVALLEPANPRANGLMRLADDLVAAPWNPDEVARRVISLIRAHPEGEARLEFGPLIIESATRTVSIGGKEVHLTPTEYDLLYHLAVERGRVLTHDELLHRVWGEQYTECSDYLWVHLSRLRRKLSLPGQPPLIVTERGVGYRLRIPR